MATFTYPQNELDKPQQLLALLGSFWATTYTGNSLIQDTTAAAGRLSAESHYKFLELLNSISRKDINVFNKEDWVPITFTQSELTELQTEAIKYGDNYTYTSGSNTAYGNVVPLDVYRIAKPNGLKSARLIFSRVTEASVVLTLNIDFWLDDNYILLKENPFDNPLIDKREILHSDGSIKDVEITLWVYRGLYDKDAIYNQFGYALGLKLSSSEGYKSFINAIFDALVGGTSKQAQQVAIAAATGIPIVIEASETVQDITNDSRYLNIITDQHVYQYPLGAAAIVSEGDTVQAGDSLTDLLQTFELGRGTEISPTDISAITIQSGMLSGDYWQGITFENKTTDLIVQEDVDGYTKVSWELGGFDLDIARFWDTVHAAGIAVNNTLAMLLDVRDNPSDQPTAASLPTDINPLQFLADNLLRNNAYVIKLKTGFSLPDALEFIPEAQLRQIQPPHTTFILLLTLTYADMPLVLEAAGTETSAGYEESQSGFVVSTVADVMMGTTSITEKVNIYSIQGRCI